MDVLLLLSFILAVLSANGLVPGFEYSIVRLPAPEVGWSPDYSQLNGAPITTLGLHSDPNNPLWNVGASASIDPQGRLSVSTSYMAKALLIHKGKAVIIRPASKEGFPALPNMMVVLVGSPMVSSIDSCLDQIVAAQMLHASLGPWDTMSLVQSLGRDNKCAGLSLLVACTLSPPRGTATPRNQPPRHFVNLYRDELRGRLGLPQISPEDEEAMEEEW